MRDECERGSRCSAGRVLRPRVMRPSTSLSRGSGNGPGRCDRQAKEGSGRGVGDTAAVLQDAACLKTQAIMGQQAAYQHLKLKTTSHGLIA